MSKKSREKNTLVQQLKKITKVRVQNKDSKLNLDLKDQDQVLKVKK